MSLTNVKFTRAQLQDLPAKRRREAIANAVNNVYQQVISAATEGKVFCIVDISQVIRKPMGCHAIYVPNSNDMAEGLQAAFPDCKVEYTETWEDTQPGIRQQKKGILVDWS